MRPWAYGFEDVVKTRTSMARSILLFMAIVSARFMPLVLATGAASAETVGDFDYRLINNGTEVEFVGYHGCSDNRSEGGSNSFVAANHP